VQQALSKLMASPEPAKVAETPQFSENIQDIYENIKTALRLLQANIQVSGNKLEIPDEIRQIFQNLQADLKLSEISDDLLQQVTHLRSLVEGAGLPFEKIAEEVLNTLTEMAKHLTRLKNSPQVHELRAFLENQLKPNLKLLSEIFNNTKLMQEMDDPGKAAEIVKTLQSLQKSAESALAGGLDQSLEFSRLTEISDRLANLPQSLKATLDRLPANLRTSENIAHLSQNIEDLLSRLPNQLETTANGSAFLSKISDLLSTLRNHFEPLDLGDSALKLVPKLKSFVQDSGIFFEKKMSDIISRITEASTRIGDVRNLEQLPEIRTIINNDLKPNLMQLRDFLNNERLTSQLEQLGDQRTLESIRNAVEELLSNMGSQQERAVDGQAQQNPVQVFSFHLPIKGEETAELKVFYNRGRQKESPDEYKMSLFLDMDKIGEIRTDFLHIKEELSITFFVKDDRIKDYFDESLYEVHEILGPMFKDLNMNVIVSREKIADFEFQEREEEVISDKAVNVKV
jgi:hypothetical protein